MPLPKPINHIILRAQEQVNLCRNTWFGGVSSSPLASSQNITTLLLLLPSFPSCNSILPMELPVRSPVSGGRRQTTYQLEAINISYKLPRASSSKQILKDVNCEARPGEVTAIAGPSGAGKTTLVQILAGRISPRIVQGQVLANGRPMDAKHFRRLSGFVTQEDALFPSLTVQETLMYSALLRLPGARNEAANRVQRLISELGLDHVANSRIGDGSKWGISGGERRRVSVGVDLIHDPAVVLIDEPTSGLDSASAFHVVALLKSMAIDQGKTIVLTIHQPGFRILELFDRVVVLSNGHAMHNGSLRSLHDRLRRAGHLIPRRVNVLEFAIDVIDALSVETPVSHRRTTNSQGGQEKLVSGENSLSEEVLILGKRFSSNIFRTKQLFVTRVIQASISGLVVGTIFLNVGNETGPMALQTQIGFFAFTLTFLLTSTTEVLPIFLQERRILMRETSTGAYRISAYVLSNTLVFLPFLLMISLLYSVSVYWLVGLRRDIDGFLYFSLVVWMVVLMSNSFVACFSAIVPNFIMGTSVISGFIGSFFLFSGYFISKDRIPDYWIFMHYLSLFKYPFESFLINEFGGERGRRRCLEFDEPGKCSLYRSDFIGQQGLQESQKWTNLAVMFGFIVGYRVLCLVILWYRHSTSR